MRRHPVAFGAVLGVVGVYVYHRLVGVPTGVKGKVPGGSIG
jgi:hypothetical protein